MLPSLYLTYTMLQQTRFTQNAARFVAKECVFPDTRVLSSDAEIDKGHKTITITLMGKILPTDSLNLALSSKLPFYHLTGTQINIIQGYAATVSDNSSQSVKDIYEMAQKSILSKQAAIDSLRDVIHEATLNDTIAGRIAPEIKVLFPQIKELAVTRAIFGNIDTAALDTVNVVMVEYTRPLPRAKEEELARYLEARLSLHSVSIVNIGNLNVRTKDNK